MNFTRITSIISPISVARNNLDFWIKITYVFLGFFLEKNWNFTKWRRNLFPRITNKVGRWRILFSPYTLFCFEICTRTVCIFSCVSKETSLRNANTECLQLPLSVFSRLLSIFLSVTYHCVCVCCFCYFSFAALCSYCSCDDFHCMAVKHDSQLEMEFLIFGEICDISW